MHNSVPTYGVLFSAAKSSQGVGTRWMWHSRCWWWTMTLRLVLQCIDHTNLYWFFQYLLLQPIHNEIKMSHLCACKIGMHSDRDLVWSKIGHPSFLHDSHQCMVIYISPTNTLEFPRANILDKRPFIVMPYMRNWNSRDHLQWHPNSDQLQIVCIFNIHAFTLAQCDNLQLHGISLSLIHFNPLQIVHGDLKAVRSCEK